MPLSDKQMLCENCRREQAAIALAQLSKALNMDPTAVAALLVVMREIIWRMKQCR
jgi:hypothetical protein